MVLGGVAIVAILLPVSFFVYSHVENPAVQKLIIGSTLVGLALLVAFIGSRGFRKAA